MACVGRQQSGSCSHFQCPYSTDTQHHYECVDIVKGFCEAGENCLPKCKHSWQKNDTERSSAAYKAFEALYAAAARDYLSENNNGR